MFIRKFFRLLRPEDDGMGAMSAPPAVDASAPIDAPAAPVAAPAPAASSPAPAPRTMLDAIKDRFDPAITDLATGQPRDPQGRFAQKNVDGSPVAAPVVANPAVVKPVAPVVPAVPEDLTAMPEGLQPKAQERFQKLANTVKERETERDEARGQVSYIRDTFQRHGIQQPQFEQAAEVLGMMNRGDFQGALKALDEQRRQISLILGQPVPGVDALSDFPDLRQAVDNMQVSEGHALELARARAQQLSGQRQQQERQQAQQSQEQERAAVQTATQAVDQLCKGLASSDMDYPAIEAQLLPAIGDLLRGVPPNQWENAVRTQYSLLKRMASTVRQNGQPAAAVLRPTGQVSPGAAPKTMHEAMWGAPARS